MELIIAILAGICPDWWPWGRGKRPRWRNWPPIPFPIPEPRPGPDPSPMAGPVEPVPWRPTDARPVSDPWTLIGGIACGLGGAIAWVAVGREFGDDGSILVPAITGFLGGTTAGWAVDSVRDMMGSQ
jgi:hypothetical protein